MIHDFDSNLRQFAEELKMAEDLEIELEKPDVGQNQQIKPETEESEE